MYIKRGFELLETRLPEDQLDVEFFEKKYNIVLPPLYKVFMQTFVVKTNEIKGEKLLNKDETYSYVAQSMYKGIEGTESFTSFNELDLVLSIKDEIEEWSTNKYLPIADAFDGHGAILVGTQESNQDQIILHDNDYLASGNHQFIKIADNIFEFTRSLYLEYEFFAEDVDHTKLYRNWGEEFWRLKK